MLKSPNSTNDERGGARLAVILACGLLALSLALSTSVALAGKGGNGHGNGNGSSHGHGAHATTVIPTDPNASPDDPAPPDYQPDPEPTVAAPVAGPAGPANHGHGHGAPADSGHQHGAPVDPGHQHGAPDAGAGSTDVDFAPHGNGEHHRGPKPAGDSQGHGTDHATGRTPVSYCHWVPAVSHSYNYLTTDDDGVLSGHSGHGNDIIPAFGYTDNHGSAQSFPGQNLGGDGSVVLANGCRPAPPLVDVCPNITGVQGSVPEGLVKDAEGDCVTPPPADVCPNIDGIQTSVPEGMVKNATGDCVAAPQEVDVCPNIEGMQASVPDGLVLTSAGTCVAVPVVSTTPAPTHNAVLAAKRIRLKVVRGAAELPFTGLDTRAIAAAGLVLLLVGGALRKRFRRRVAG